MLTYVTNNIKTGTKRRHRARCAKYSTHLVRVTKVMLTNVTNNSYVNQCNQQYLC